jgi:uncharacterized MAPEG superfamily protein
MSTELTFLTWTCALTSVMWIPYILDMILVRGLADAVGYPDDPKPLAGWAQRMKNAHYNAIENLAVFAALILVVHAAARTSEVTAAAAQIYFWARLVHFVSYAAKVPLVRTLSFVVGFGCQVALAWQLLA